MCNINQSDMYYRLVNVVNNSYDTKIINSKRIELVYDINGSFVTLLNVKVLLKITDRLYLNLLYDYCNIDYYNNILRENIIDFQFEISEADRKILDSYDDINKKKDLLSYGIGDMKTRKIYYLPAMIYTDILENDICVLLLKNEEIIGSGISKFYIKNNEIYIQNINIVEEERGKGLCTHIVDFLLTKSFEKYNINSQTIIKIDNAGGEISKKCYLKSINKINWKLITEIGNQMIWQKN